MDDLTNILLKSSLTVFSAVLIFVIVQLLSKFVIEPIQELKSLLCEVQSSLAFHAQAISTPTGNKESEGKAQKILRKASCDLHSRIGVIPFYQWWSKISRGVLPCKNNVLEASKLLMGISNSVHQPNRSNKNVDRIANIERLLNYESNEVK
ncbi:MAG: hypothetical protein GXP21_08735 [Gammaproteobacteria bacterium]|nr:hypothetical protein [Gammaproteobacteria bacterium]